MQEHNMNLLDAHGAIVGNTKMDVCAFQDIVYFTAAIACQGDDDHIAFMGYLDGAQHVFRVAAGADRDQDVTGLAQGANLALETRSIAIIVAHCSQYGSISVQGDASQGQSFALETADQLGNEMLGIGSRAPIAAGQNFTVIGQGGKEQFDRSSKGEGELSGTFLKRLCTSHKVAVHMGSEIHGVLTRR